MLHLGYYLMFDEGINKFPTNQSMISMNFVVQNGEGIKKWFPYGGMKNSCHTKAPKPMHVEIK